MTGVYLEDGTSIHFDQEKYRILFEGMTVFFFVRKEFASINRPKKMILDYAIKQFTQIWEDGPISEDKFKGMI